MAADAVETTSNQLIKNGETIACLKENNYRAETGGIIYYSTLPPETKRKRSTKQIFTGVLYWIPEATYTLNALNLEALKSINGNFLPKGSAILPNSYSKTAGFISIVEDDFELGIKPGELYQLNGQQRDTIIKRNRFVKISFLGKKDLSNYSDIFLAIS